MTITPPSDIVLDVARAADPEKYRAAVDRLIRLRETAAAAETPAPAAVVATPSPPAEPSPTATRLPQLGTGLRRHRPLDAYGQFEAFVLQSFVQSMLPRNATSVFGKGSAGEFWKSMLAEKIGSEIARSGQVGIAQRLAAGPVHPSQPASVHMSEAPPPSPPLASAVARTSPTVPVELPTPVTVPHERS